MKEALIFTVPSFHIESLRSHCVIVKGGIAQDVIAGDYSNATLEDTDAYLEVTYFDVEEFSGGKQWGSVKKTWWTAYKVTTDKVEFALYAESEDHVKLQLDSIKNATVEERE